MLPAFSWKNSMVGRWRLVALPQPMGCRYQACSFVPSLAVRSTSCIAGTYIIFCAKWMLSCIAHRYSQQVGCKHNKGG